VAKDWATIKVWIEGAIGRLVLNRPQVRNAMNYDASLEMEEAIRELEEHARVILIQGAGKHFCAGADLQVLSSAEAARQLVLQLNRVFSQIEKLSIPVIAAVQGCALAGGFELVQACDLVVVSEDAMLGDQHINVGLIPGGGGSQRLPRRVGRQRTLSLLLTGDRLTGKQAVEWGLAYGVVPIEQLEDRALTLAHAIVTKSRAGLKSIKTLVNEGLEKPLDQAIQMEITAFLECLNGEDAQQGLRTFREKHARGPGDKFPPCRA
jgi:enoyl-CoA hydratase/carnithine racemase